MKKLIGIAIALTSINLFSLNSLVIASTENDLHIPITPQTSSDSWQEKFDRQRREEEFLDDDTEKLLNRNKKWLILGGIVFVWMGYKSLWSSR